MSEDEESPIVPDTDSPRTIGELAAMHDRMVESPEKLEEARAEIERLQGIIEGMAARIASQSDQLSRRAERNTNAEGSD